MIHCHGHCIDTGRGPWPYILTTSTVEGRHAQRTYLGMYTLEQPPSGIYLRSMKQRHRIRIESLIAMEQYP